MAAGLLMRGPSMSRRARELKSKGGLSRGGFSDGKMRRPGRSTTMAMSSSAS